MGCKRTPNKNPQAHCHQGVDAPMNINSDLHLHLVNPPHGCILSSLHTTDGHSLVPIQSTCKRIQQPNFFKLCSAPKAPKNAKPSPNKPLPVPLLLLLDSNTTTTLARLRNGAASRARTGTCWHLTLLHCAC
jgi:hypothetical protein